MQPAQKSKFSLPQSVQASLLFFALASGIALTIIPNYFSTARNTQPPFVLFLAAGLAMIVITAAFFRFLSTLKLGFKFSALVLAFGYNAVIAVIKFILSPHALYSQGTIDGTFGNPNSAMYQFLIASCMLLLYLLVFTVIYRISRRRVEQALGMPGRPKRHLARKIIPTVLALTILAGVLSGGMVVIFALLVFGAPLSYLGFIGSSVGIPVAVAIALAIYLAVRSFRVVEEQAVATKNATLLASFFWIGLSLIVLFHVLWVVFILTLVHIWPFNTYTPK